MNEKLIDYLNGVFAPYDGIKSVEELKSDLLADLQERFRELKAEGKDDAAAFEATIDSIGDIEQTVREAAGLTRSLERQLLINFSAGNLPRSDFAGVTVHKGKFEASALGGSDFSGADLTGSSFKASDVRDANFDGESDGLQLLRAGPLGRELPPLRPHAHGFQGVRSEGCQIHQRAADRRQADRVRPAKDNL